MMKLEKNLIKLTNGLLVELIIMVHILMGIFVGRRMKLKLEIILDKRIIRQVLREFQPELGMVLNIGAHNG